MAAESAGRCKLAELVTNHRLGDKHRHVLASVVHCDGVPEHVGNNHRAAGPSLNNILGALLVLSRYLQVEVLINEKGPSSNYEACVRLLSASCQYDGDER